MKLILMIALFSAACFAELAASCSTCRSGEPITFTATDVPEIHGSKEHYLACFEPGSCGLLPKSQYYPVNGVMTFQWAIARLGPVRVCLVWSRWNKPDVTIGCVDLVIE